VVASVGGVGRRRPLNGFEYQIEGVFINGVELEHSVLLPLFALCSHEACIASHTRTHIHTSTHMDPHTQACAQTHAMHLVSKESFYSPHYSVGVDISVIVCTRMLMEARA
jgi:hypothetical protein